jgi:PAS domain-containing protein
MLLVRVHPDDRDRVQKALVQAFEVRADFRLEYRLLMPNGSVKHIHSSARVATTSSGNLELVGAVTDVTTAKQVEGGGVKMNKNFATLPMRSRN